MRRELLASKKKETGLSLDPRTKLALLITIALFVLSGGGGAASKQFAPILAAVPLILLLTEKLFPHLAEIDAACKNRLDIIETAMMRQEGVTEALKTTDQMEWVRRMNSIHSRAEEIVLHELAYAE